MIDLCFFSYLKMPIAAGLKLIWMEDLGAIAPYSLLHVIKLQFTGHKSLH